MRYSVIMPAHRVHEYLRPAVESVERAIAQDDAELIVVANGPNRDAVAEAVKGVSNLATTRVIVTAIPSIIYALNRAIDAARGDYVARFDSDDVCIADRFSRQYEAAVRERADFLFSDAEVIGADGTPTGRRLISNILSLWNRCGPVHPTAFMRRDALLALGGYGSYEYCEDYHLWLRAEARGCRFVVDHELAIQYRVHGSQITDDSTLSEIFATGAGIKLILSLRGRQPKLLLGAGLDLGRWIYRRCRNAFS
jgi:O86/O127-antigen biosynthesis beta-1,3-galactosyltransferase